MCMRYATQVLLTRQQYHCNRIKRRKKPSTLYKFESPGNILCDFSLNLFYFCNKINIDYIIC